MHPYEVHLFGATIAIWDVLFVVAVAAAFPVFRTCTRATPEFSNQALRFLVIVYLSALAAQLFANAFDAGGSLRPPPGRSYASWYLNPVGGVKTLYGVIVLMPVTVGIATVGLRMSLQKALDLCTPAMFVVLAIVRVGCFLQGCCYGAASSIFGIAFPINSPVYYHQLQSELISAGSPPLPVIPTQLVESAFLALIARSTYRNQELSGTLRVFVPAISTYSLFRFVIEFLRADAERGFYGPLSTSQWIALVVLAASVLALRRSYSEAAPACSHAT